MHTFTCSNNNQGWCLLHHVRIEVWNGLSQILRPWSRTPTQSFICMSHVSLDEMKICGSSCPSNVIWSWYFWSETQKLDKHKGQRIMALILFILLRWFRSFYFFIDFLVDTQKTRNFSSITSVTIVLCNFLLCLVFFKFITLNYSEANTFLKSVVR